VCYEIAASSEVGARGIIHGWARFWWVVVGDEIVWRMFG
jgi:hypothetical protein